MGTTVDDLEGRADKLDDHESWSGAGDDGGQIIATGTPEEIAQNKNSSTGQYLRAMLLKREKIFNEQPYK